jgi:hypothetical protein
MPLEQAVSGVQLPSLVCFGRRVREEDQSEMSGMDQLLRTFQSLRSTPDRLESDSAYLRDETSVESM